MNQEKKVKKYYRFHSLIYDATRWLFLFGRKKAIDKLELKNDNFVIDFACGTGLNIPHLLKKTKSISAIDFSDDMLKVAKKKYPAVTFVQGDACTYLFEQKADKILCTYSLSLIENWSEAIKNMSRNLKENGTILILDFSMWHGIVNFFYPLMKWWLKIHSVDSEMPIEDELKKYFRNIEMKTYLSGYYFIAVASGVKK